MKNVAIVAIIVGVISLAIGIISRLTLTPIKALGGLEAQAMLSFANTCLLLAIAVLILEMAKGK